jgi:hypothetical protein
MFRRRGIVQTWRVWIPCVLFSFISDPSEIFSYHRIYGMSLKVMPHQGRSNRQSSFVQVSCQGRHLVNWMLGRGRGLTFATSFYGYVVIQ